MLTDEEVADIERDIRACARCGNEAAWSHLLRVAETLLAEVKKLRAEAKLPPLLFAKHGASMTATDREILLAALEDLGGGRGAVLLPNTTVEFGYLATEITRFRTLFDAMLIDYHVEHHHGPSGSPINGASCSIELGSEEFAFDGEGRFLGWCEFEITGHIEDSETHIHLRGGGE